MPPLEHLRALVRRRDLGSREACVEVLACLGAFGDDPAGLVLACRRLLAHRPDDARLWWAAARVLVAASPAAAAQAAAALIDGDDTGTRLAEALPFPAAAPVAFTEPSEESAEALAVRPDVEAVVLPGAPPRPGGVRGRTVAVAAALTLGADPLVVRPAALGEGAVLVHPEAATALREFRRAGREVWALVPTGTRLPGPLLEAMARQAGEALRRVDLGGVARLVGAAADAGAAGQGCPVAQELLSPGR